MILLILKGLHWSHRISFIHFILFFRYMSTPQENPIGYNTSSVLARAQNVKNNQMLLMHGTGDDNVHWQNTAEFARVQIWHCFQADSFFCHWRKALSNFFCSSLQRLISNEISFDTMFYPNKAHDISGDGARRHLWKKMSDFLMNIVEQ